MPKDYLLERVKELNQLLAAIMDSKKDHPSKALELIYQAFSATKFKKKETFDNFTVSELEAFVKRENIDYSNVDNIIDILFEEAEIKPGQPLLLDKIGALITYTAQKEKEDKIFSFKRGYQRDRLKKMMA
jgi:hypothetical protein